MLPGTRETSAVAELDQVLGRIIAAQRLKAGLTQEVLAFECGLHPTYISQLERGLKSPTVRVLCLLAQAMGERPSVLLTLAERRQRRDAGDPGCKSSPARKRPAR